MKTIPVAVLILMMISLLPASLMLIRVDSAELFDGISVEGPLNNIEPERDHFIENGGQLSRVDIRFYSLGTFRVGFTDHSIVFAITDPDEGVYSYEMEFSGARRVEPEGIDPDEAYYNFMIGEKDRWVSGLSCYKRIMYEDLWDGIDLVYYINEGSIKYDLVVEPGADPSVIGFDLIGLEDASIDDEGDLMLRTPFGTVSDSGLVSIQCGESIRTDFKLKGNHLGFEIGDYDTTEPVVIDPLIQYCTYLGGSNSENNILDSMLVDGDVILTGMTYSSNFPTTSGVIDRTSINGEGIITRMNGDLGSLVFSTCFGGESTDAITGMDLDPSGDIYVSGVTYSKQFPITSGVMNETSKIDMVETPWGGEELAPDVFVSKISSDGTDLIYSTYIAGNHTDHNHGIAVDDNGYAYVISSVVSEDLPIKNAYQSGKNGYNDFYLIKMNRNASDFEWATYLGGEDDEWSSEGPTDVKISPSGDIFISGNSASMDFPTTSSAFKQSTTSRWMTGVMASFESDGDMIFSTYIHEDTDVTSLEVTEDSVFLTGYTSMSDFPVTKSTAYDDSLGGWGDAFLLEMDTSGSLVKYGTFIGGDGDEYGYDISFDGEGRPMITGYTLSEDFPLSDYPLDDSLDGWADSFITILSLDRTDIHFSSYFGGNQDDMGFGVEVDGNGGLYLTGITGSTDLPVHDDAYDKTYSNGDFFISRIKVNSFPPSRPVALTAERGDENVTLSWSPPLKDGNETVSKYNIYMSQLNRTFEIVGETEGNITSFVHEGLDNGERYYYYMTAENVVGESPPTPTLMRIPATIPSIPIITGYSTGDQSVTIEWSDPEDLGGDVDITFNVYRGPSSDEMVPVESNLKGFLINHDDLVNGRVYFYAISASNGVGEGPRTNPIPMRPMKVPGAPENLSISRGDGYIHLYWDPPGDDGGQEELEYDLLMSTGGYESKPLANGIGKTDYNATGLINGVYYLFTVIAINEKGDGPATSGIGSFPIGVPGEPRDLMVILYDGKADLDWRIPSDIGGSESVTYNVYMESSGSDEMIASGLTESGYKMSGLTNGESYTFHVSAVNDLFEGAPSNSVTATCLGPPSVPLDVSSEGGDREITVLWNPPSDNGGDPLITYKVYMGSSPSDLAEIGETTGYSFRKTGLTNGRVHYVSVRAMNTFTMGEFSEPITSVPLSVPGIPEILLTIPGNEQIKLDWKVPIDLGGSDSVTYNIYVAEEGSSPVLEAENVTGTSYTIEGLVNGIEYTVFITSSNPMGEGQRSDPARITPVTSPPVPLNISVRSKEGEIEIVWILPADNGGSPFTDVEIFRWTVGKDPVLVATVNANKGSYIDRNVKGGVRYYYDVVGVTSVGKTPESDVVEVKTSSTDGGIDLLIPVSVAILIMTLILIVTIFLAMRREKAPTPVPQYAPIPGQYDYGLDPAGSAALQGGVSGVQSQALPPPGDPGQIRTLPPTGDPGKLRK